MVILALGKFGGREMNYHSDLDIIFLYEADGNTVAGLETKRKKGTEEISPYTSSASRVFREISSVPLVLGREPNHDQPALLQRTWAADHQSGQPA